MIFPQSVQHARMSRRSLLKVGALSYLGASLPHLLQAEDRAGHASKADSCIVLFLNGGPSHLDMWDMKPNAPAEIRGEFQPIASSLPGYQISEHLPLMSKWMHKATVVRSMHHSVNNSHAAAVYVALTGHDRGEMGGGAKPTDHPPPGSVMAKLRPSESDIFPYVTLPYKTQEGAGGPLQPGFLAGFLGAAHDPFWVVDDPNAPSFEVQNLALPSSVDLDRFTSRNQLLSGLDRHMDVRGEPALASMTDFQRQAFHLLTSPKAKLAFDVSQEKAETREKYGRNIYGQSVLLARRLLEAGTRMVTVSWAPDANATWDTHGSNFDKLKKTLLPQFDAAYSSLMQDLSDRGMLERTIVAVLGDFGRTPKINNNAGGRDHWNNCYSIVLAGGGFREGLVFGESDNFGGVPISGALTPGDIIATIYRQLGIEPTSYIYDALARPIQIVQEGRVAHELIG